jgi:hypothetical protein
VAQLQDWKNTVSAAARPVRVDGLASHGATGRSSPAGRRLGEAHTSGAKSITDTLIESGLLIL